MFDPFQDLATAGYLRNVEGVSDLQEVKRQEHFFFESNFESALSYLRGRKGEIAYEHFLEVHRILFQDFYPWAGQDRQMLNVGRLVAKGEEITFEASELCRHAAEWALRLGNNKPGIRARPGEVMGAFAWAHPFLDGNGRAMLLVHSELCHRAGFSIDWLSSTKDGYLNALTAELKHPRAGSLDQYLAPLIIKAAPRKDWVEQFNSMPGLDGLEVVDENVAYLGDDPVANERYQEIKRSRGPTSS